MCPSSRRKWKRRCCGGAKPAQLGGALWGPSPFRSPCVMRAVLKGWHVKLRTRYRRYPVIYGPVGPRGRPRPAPSSAPRLGLGARGTRALPSWPFYQRKGLWLAHLGGHSRCPDSKIIATIHCMSLIEPPNKAYRTLHRDIPLYPLHIIPFIPLDPLRPLGSISVLSFTYITSLWCSDIRCLLKSEIREAEKYHVFVSSVTIISALIAYPSVFLRHSSEISLVNRKQNSLRLTSSAVFLANIRHFFLLC